MEGKSYRLFRSTSAFLQTKLEYRRPTPLILVKAYITFCLPSTLVFRRRKIYLPELLASMSQCVKKLFAGDVRDLPRQPSTTAPTVVEIESNRQQWQGSALLTNWKFVFSPETSDMMGNCNGRCRVLDNGRWIRVKGREAEIWSALA